MFRHGDRPLEGLTVQRAVGRGGFGEVYFAVTDAGKEVALKYLREHAEIELRGVGEVMNLKSPHLVTIFDVRQNGTGESFVIMEYVSGPSLRDVLRFEPNGLSPEKAVFFLNGIAEGLNHLHERGVVHRDLKPANIFYDAGYVKIGDYGLSKHMSVSQHSGQTVSIGTVHYMAPEVGSGQYTKLVDVYALGVILYEMLIGRPPFTGASIQEVLIRQLRDEPNTSVLPAEFAPIVAKALAKDPAQRYQSALELADAAARLENVQSRLSGFDPLTLTQVPRAAPAVADTPTRTTPPIPPAPALDARQAAWRDEPRRPVGTIQPYPVSPHAKEYGIPREDEFTTPLTATIALGGVFTFLAFVFSVTGGRPVALAVSVPVLIPLVIAKCFLIYRWWATLPNGWGRTTPPKAVGFGFIPFFSWYWVFVVYYGLAGDLNRYLRAHGEQQVQVPAGLTLGYSIIAVLTSLMALMQLHAAAGMVLSYALFISVAVSLTRACRAVVRTRMDLIKARRPGT